MVLPSRGVIKDIRRLINEITGFEEDEENFYICEQYCLSHIMHHSYPSVNRFEVKKLLDGYVRRFFIHGYFKVADGLEAEVTSFLSHECLFKKNSESDIQWKVLNLVTALATNLTSVTKLPKIVPVKEDDKPTDEINWGEYLKEGLPSYFNYSPDKELDSDNSSHLSENSDTDVQGGGESCDLEKSHKDTVEENEKAIEDEVKINSFYTCRQHIIDELVKRRDEEISYKRDVVLRGNFIEELGFFMTVKPSISKPQILSEFEVVGCVLNQFLTGENVFKRKGISNPATCSLTEVLEPFTKQQVTIKNYLNSIQPYVNMITIFKEFRNEVSLIESGEYSESLKYKFNQSKPSHPNNLDSTFKESVYNNLNKMSARSNKSLPNVVKLYNLALIETLKSFESKILIMSEFQNSYTLLQVLYELRPSFSDLSSLFAVHLSATTNWLNEPNWLCSVRIIAALYKAVLHSTSNRMGFLFMNILLFCFQAYLDITDNWISCMTLNDPREEYIIYRTKDEGNGQSNSYTYNVRNYAEELRRIGLNKIPILDHLAEKMIHVGHSIDVLQRLDRSLIKEQVKAGFSQENLYKRLLKNVKKELRILEETIPKIHTECTELTFFGGKTSICENVVHDISQNNLSDVNNTNSSTDMYSFKTANDSSYKEVMSVDSDVTSKDIALSDFCMKLCEMDKTERIEKSIWPLAMKIDTSVMNIINSRVLNTCDLAKDVVVNQFQLKIHLRLLRNVFLFNDPHLILPFMSALFHKESLRQNSYALSTLIRECLESRYKEQAQYLSVTIEENSKEAPGNILQAINRININYEVHWPLQLIFTPHIMKIYNDIFRHLFKLHWAHETLCKLRFTVVSNETPLIVKSSFRRLELLRFWCLSSLARLRSYFMAQIATPFDLQLNSYQHLKHIIKAHEIFIEKIHSRCLLCDENSEGKDLIFNILIPLCWDIYHNWSSGYFVPDSKLSHIENIFFESQKRFHRLMAELEDE